ncbi:MAG: DUF808 domain-containing protein [Deltaproteobacteria bacterium]|nr:DUF808 domain-containing protein [Deltaproteobacteria bacterium]
MAATGLIALLDDIASIADDVATLTAMAAKKSSGIVTDDMAVTAEQAVGIKREREIPVVLAVARGSFFNKAVILAPSALALNAVAPWSITPILMLGGAFLAYEGAEKVLHKLRPPDGDEDDDGTPDADDPVAFEALRVKGAIRTDLVLSAEILALTLGQIKAEPLVTQVGVMYTMSVVMTVGVYGIVAGLIKLDDLGEYLATRGKKRAWLGRFILRFAPTLMHAISVIGTAAMLVVGGGILVEGIPGAHHAVEHVLEGLPMHGLLMVLAQFLSGLFAGVAIIGLLSWFKAVKARIRR